MPSPPDRASDPDPAHPGDGDPRIEVRRHGHRVDSEPLVAKGTLIGRGEKAHVRLPDESVSREHAMVSRDERGRWWVEDLGSINGTWMNGGEVRRAPLRGGDRFEIADYELRIIGIEDGDASTYTRSATTTTFAPLPFAEGRGAQISTLVEIGSPKIDTTHLTTINEFAHRLGQIEDEGERLQELCRLVVQPSFHGRAAVALRLDLADDDAPPEVISSLEVRPGAPDDAPHLSRSLLRIVRQSRSPAIAANSSTDPGAIKMTIIGPQDESAAAACPIGNEGETLDVLYVTLPPQYGTGEWLTLLAHAAQRFEQIEMARDAQAHYELNAAHARELHQAAKIQAGLVPDDPNVPGLRVALGFEPCRGVGGDYVDVLPMDDGSALLAIADVCGKGLPAAIVASTVHSMVHACRRARVDLGEMSSALNDHLCRFLSDSAFVTMATMLLDPATGAFELINAGHPSPVIVSPTGETRTLGMGLNMPLGVMPGTFTSERGMLERGEMIGLFTDGLTELSGEDGEMLGMEGIAAALADLRRAEPAGELDPDHVAAALTAFLDGLQGDRAPLDDRTFLLAARAQEG